VDVRKSYDAPNGVAELVSGGQTKQLRYKNNQQHQSNRFKIVFETVCVLQPFASAVMVLQQVKQTIYKSQFHYPIQIKKKGWWRFHHYY
jgi:hypothetical protein